MPRGPARTTKSRCRGGLRPCLTGPARGGLPMGRSGRRDGQPSVEHRDGSCGGLLLVDVLGPTVEWAPLSEPLQSPRCIVALHEGGYRSFDFSGSAEGSAPDRLLLEGSEQPLDAERVNDFETAGNRDQACPAGVFRGGLIQVAVGLAGGRGGLLTKRS